MKKLRDVLLRKRIWRDTRGQDLIEYAMIAGFIAIVAAAVFPGITNSISTIFSSIGSKVDANTANIH